MIEENPEVVTGRIPEGQILGMKGLRCEGKGHLLLLVMMIETGRSLLGTEAEVI